MTPEERLRLVEQNVQEIKDLMNEARGGIRILCWLMWVVLLVITLKGEIGTELISWLGWRP